MTITTNEMLSSIKNYTVKGKVNLLMFDIRTNRKYTEIINEITKEYIKIEQKLEQLIKINKDNEN